MQMIYPGKAQLRVRTACSETCVQVTCWHIISCLSALRITVDFLLKAFTSHICSCIYYRFIPGSGGKWLSRSAPNPISLSKERHKHLLLGIWNTLKKEQHPPKSARQGWSLGLGCSHKHSHVPRSHRNPGRGTWPKRLLPCGVKQISWRISPSAPHQKAKPPRLHLGMIFNDFRETFPLKHKWSCASLH